MKVLAPAKINLSLRILGRREDGFHELETLMVSLPGLADELSFEEATTYSLEVEGGDVGPEEDNLVTRAVRVYEKRSRERMAFRVRLVKRIPAGAGLGGGSSDAAATLRALNTLSGRKFEESVLEEMAAELGSDVSFFLREGACWCRGRGEVLEPADIAPPQEVLLLKPAFGVSTVDAYGRWSGARELPGIVYGPQQVAGLELVNDLERPVFEKFLFLAELKVWLLAQPEVEAALMSGSGATVYAVLREGGTGAEVARRAQEELDPKLWWWAGGAE